MLAIDGSVKSQAGADALVQRKKDNIVQDFEAQERRDKERKNTIFEHLRELPKISKSIKFHDLETGGVVVQIHVPTNQTQSELISTQALLGFVQGKSEETRRIYLDSKTSMESLTIDALADALKTRARGFPILTGQGTCFDVSLRIAARTAIIQIKASAGKKVLEAIQTLILDSLLWMFHFATRRMNFIRNQTEKTSNGNIYKQLLPYLKFHIFTTQSDPESHFDAEPIFEKLLEERRSAMLSQDNNQENIPRKTVVILSQATPTPKLDSIDASQINYILFLVLLDVSWQAAAIRTTQSSHDGNFIHSVTDQIDVAYLVKHARTRLQRLITARSYETYQAQKKQRKQDHEEALIKNKSDFQKPKIGPKPLNPCKGEKGKAAFDKCIKSLIAEETSALRQQLTLSLLADSDGLKRLDHAFSNFTTHTIEEIRFQLDELDPAVKNPGAKPERILDLQALEKEEVKEQAKEEKAQTKAEKSARLKEALRIKRNTEAREKRAKSKPEPTIKRSVSVSKQDVHEPAPKRPGFVQTKSLIRSASRPPPDEETIAKAKENALKTVLKQREKQEKKEKSDKAKMAKKMVEAAAFREKMKAKTKLIDDKAAAKLAKAAQPKAPRAKSAKPKDPEPVMEPPVDAPLMMSVPGLPGAPLEPMESNP